MNITLKMPCSDQEIKEEITKLFAEINIRQSENELLSKAVKHYQSLCNHPGQETGYNERDGSWANPCPICRESH